MIDYLVNQCRFLPVSVQGYLFMSFYAIFQIPYIMGYFWWLILGLEVLVLLILIQKNIVYRNVSVVEKAIKWGVFWVKTNNARKIINLYLIGGLIFLLTTMLLHTFWYQELSIKLITIYLLGILFTLKGVFYTPIVTIRYNRDEYYLALFNEYKKTKIMVNFSDFSRIEILNSGLKILNTNHKEVLKMEINFLDGNNDTSLDDIFNERVRLQQFLEGILPHKEILVIY